MRKDLKSTELVLVVLRHRPNVNLVDGADAADVLDVRVVHRPERVEYADPSDRPDIDEDRSACGHNFAFGPHAVVDQRILNKRALRLCRHQACFGEGR